MQTRSISRYILVVLCVSVVTTTIVLIGLNAFMNNTTRSPQSAPIANEGYVQGFMAARERFKTMTHYGILPNQNTILVGKVLEATSDHLLVQQQTLDTDPRVDGVQDERTITLEGDGKAYQETTKHPDQLKTELQLFHANQMPQPNMVPPTASTLTPIALSDIPVGAIVRISSHTDIRLSPAISATEIIYIRENVN